MANRLQLLNNIYRYNLDLLRSINPDSVFTQTDIMVGADDWLMITWYISGKEKQRQVGEVCKRLHRRLNPKKRSKKGVQLKIE